jgi:mono/diheme cytochrome c family protein
MSSVCRCNVGLCCLALALCLVAAPQARAVPNAEQRAEILALGTQMTKAGNLYKGGKFKEAADVIKEAQGRLDKLVEGADESVIDALQPLHKRLLNAHALLELEGVTLPELKPLEAKPAAGKPAGDKPAPGGAAPAGAVSFVKQVAPILNSRCGNCHVRNARGMFSMSTYEQLMKGPPAGKVVFPANVDGSDLIVKVKDKEMPPSGAGIPDAELATLTKWVEEGAKFDGADPTATLTSLLPAGAGQPAAPMIAVQAATGKETVSFAKDIAPVFVKSCVGCHGTNRPRNNFSLNTIEGLLKGGDRGEPVLPGKPADSLIIKKLKGTADGAQMPMGQTPLDGAVIAKIEKWIEEGAKFDGPDPKQPIAEVAAIAKASSQTHEELTADRAILADSNWRLGMPGIDANRSESTNFLVLGGGSVGENTLADIAQRAEAVAPKVGEIFKAPPDQALIKGKMTLFVFGERYDYGEFGKMVEKRDLPPAWRGHYRYSIVDAYGAVLTSRTGDYSLDALIAQQLGAVYVASQGRGVPHWFAEGSGRVVAERMATADDKRVALWGEELPRALGSLASPDDFITGKMPPEDTDLCAFSFVKFLMADNSKYQAVLGSLRKGSDFNTAFSTAYGGSPAQVAASWIRKPPMLSKRPAAKKGK